jgi:hypothetical protein
MSAENFWSKIRSVRSVNLSSAYNGPGNAGSGSTRIPDDRQPPANAAPQSSRPQSDGAKVTSLIEALSLQPNHPPSQNSNSSNGSRNFDGSGAHAHSGHGTPSDIGMWRRPASRRIFIMHQLVSYPVKRPFLTHPRPHGPWATLYHGGLPPARFSAIHMLQVQRLFLVGNLTRRLTKTIVYPNAVGVDIVPQ